jgi:S-adenosylmethionine synthetase
MTTYPRDMLFTSESVTEGHPDKLCDQILSLTNVYGLIRNHMARYVAKNVVAAGLADECLLQLSYCIGLTDPISVMVNTQGTGKFADSALAELVQSVFPLSPRGMIDLLDLRRSRMKVE